MPKLSLFLKKETLKTWLNIDPPLCWMLFIRSLLRSFDRGFLTSLTHTFVIPNSGSGKTASTTDALFIARRLQDLGERSGDNIVICMLHWKQAFDRISHPGWCRPWRGWTYQENSDMQAFTRTLPSKWNTKKNLSHAKSQDAGIRQGCPPSPFLFILVMTVLFRDIGVEHYSHYRDLSECRLDQISFNEVLYADDTLLVSRNAFGMNLLLHAIEEESAYYGLKLNHDKCHVLAMKGHNCIRFEDGSRMQHVEEAVYFGGFLTKHVNIASEVSNRIASAMATWKSLDFFWKEAQCSTRNKNIIYNAIIQSKHPYALETIEIPVALLSRLESFRLKGLRKILAMTTTYINRGNTNEEVFRRANLHIAANRFGTKIVPLQDILTHCRIALAAKILRQDNPALWEWSVSKKIPPHLLRYCFDGSADAGNNGRKTPWLWYGAKFVMTKVISTTPTHNLLKYCKQLINKEI